MTKMWKYRRTEGRRVNEDGKGSHGGQKEKKNIAKEAKREKTQLKKKTENNVCRYRQS